MPRLDPVARRIGDPAESTDTLHLLRFFGHVRSLGAQLHEHRIQVADPEVISEYEEISELAQEGLEVVRGAPPGRRAAMLEMSAFAAFVLERIPVLEQEWKDRRAALVAAGKLPAEQGSGGAVMSGTTAVRASGVCKSFGATVVLDGIDLTVPAGTIFALLGPNGAGKTTMVRSGHGPVLGGG